ncbi:MAG: DUF4190 domain-containing protein [Myxococcota bacterium]
MSDAPPPQTTNPLAIAALVCGLISLPCVCGCYGLPFNLIGVILGGIAMFQSSGDPTQGGKGLAIGGIAASVLSFLLGFSMFALGLAGTILGEM